MLVFVLLPYGLIVARFVFGVRFPRHGMAVTQTLIGCCFLLFPVVVVLEFVRLLPFFPHGLEAFVAILAVLALGIYASLNAQRVSIKRLAISAGPKLRGKSIVQLSDVHVGSRSTRFFTALVEKVRHLEPTWVAITGDLLDSSHVGREQLAPLEKLASKTLFVTGNHERYEGIDKVTTLLRSLGVQVLRNQEFLDDDFQFIGIDDRDSPNNLGSELEEFVPNADRYKVFLYHRPHGLESASQWGFDLMLVGHTHRGQIFPFRFIVRRFFKLTHGTHKIGEMTLHISSGTGTWGPILRLGSRNEITHVVFI